MKNKITSLKKFFKLNIKNKATLFRKYLWINMITILSTFLILVGMIFSFVTDYWKNEKEEIFIQNSHYVSNLVANNSYVEGNNIVWINGDAVKIFMDTLSNSMNIDIFVTDTKGNVIIKSVCNKTDFQGGMIPPEVIKKISEERYSQISKLNGFYKSNQYMMGEAVYSNYGGTKNIIGAVFTAMNPEFLNSFKQGMLKVLVAAIIVVIMISFFTIRRLSCSLAKPLDQMAAVASCMAKGDFTKRVQIKGNDEIAKLGNSFNNMAESLNASESVRRNFVANLSHELKTPMTTITGFIDGILDGVIKEEDETKYLKIVSSETKRLSRLVKRMLDLSGIDNDNVKIKLSDVDLLTEVLDVLLSFENRINKNDIKVMGISDCEHILIKADKDMIHQAIYNLIENAVKFTQPKGYININLTQNGQECILILENSGEKIPKEEIRFIFDRFYKTDKSRSKDKTGIGLGLYMVRKIILLHKGNITVSSGETSTVFTIKLPYEKHRKYKKKTENQ